MVKKNIPDPEEWKALWKPRRKTRGTSMDRMTSPITAITKPFHLRFVGWECETPIPFVLPPPPPPTPPLFIGNQFADEWIWDRKWVRVREWNQNAGISPSHTPLPPPHSPLSFTLSRSTTADGRDASSMWKTDCQYWTCRGVIRLELVKKN